VAIAPDAPKNIQYQEIVKTHESSYSVNDLSLANNPGQRRVISVAVAAEGSILSSVSEIEGVSEPVEGGAPSKKGGENFSAIIFGDSDFLTNQLFFQGINRDLAMNAISFLTKERDLISLRPKHPKANRVILTSVDQAMTVIGGVLLPIILFGLALFVWYRRRGA
jgi:ABC-type uncharacterized transport system involved in gliding motility auxiliary subunit